MERTNCLGNREITGLAGIFVGLNILDAALTTILVGSGGHELNSIMRYFLEQSGKIFMGTKIGLALIFTLILLLASTRFSQVKRIFAILVVCMTVICLFNGIGLLEVE